MQKFKRGITLLLVAIFFISFSSYLVGCKENKENYSSYEIDCYLEGCELTGKEKVSFYNHSENAFNVLKFNLYPNAFRKNAKYAPFNKQYESQAYFNGLNYGEIEILSVKSGKQALEYKIEGLDQNILSVSLEQEVFPTETAIVEISFKTTLPTVIARMGVNDKTINLANFYPILCGIEDGAFYECVYYSTGDPFFSDVANYKVNLTCKDTYLVASSGKLNGNIKKYNGTKTATYCIDKARSFAFVLSENYCVANAKACGIDVFYYYYDDQEYLVSLETAIKSIEYFSKTFGDYPYKTYSVCQTPFIQGGMEYSGLTFISDDLERRAFNEVIVHETAHMWWMSKVGNNEVKHAFLDEGLTEYSVILFYENHPEFNLSRSALIESTEKTFKAFCSVYDKLFNGVNTNMLRSLDEFSSEYEYVNIAYVKPCIMLDTLRQSIGDERFFKGLKKYLELYSFKVATPYDLVGAFEKVGAKSNEYFESFYNGKVII